MFTVAVNLDLLLVRVRVAGRPVRQQHLWASLLRRIVSGVSRQHGRGRDTAGDVNHRPVAPPTLALICQGARRSGAVKQAGVVSDGGPLARLTQVINPTPEKLTGIRWIVAQRQPNTTVVAVLGAKNLARRFLFMRGQDFILAVVLSHHVQQISQAVVVVVADVWTKQSLGNRTRRIVLVKRLYQRRKNLIRQLGLWRIVDFIAGAVNDHARMIAITTNGVASVNQ